MDQSQSSPFRKVFIARHGERLDHIDPSWAATAPREHARWKLPDPELLVLPLVIHPTPFDPPLTARGEAQARCLAKRLKDEGVHHIVASPYIRTLQTANAVAELLDVPIFVDYGMQEWFGDGILVDERQPLPLNQLKEMFPRIDTSYEPFHHPIYGVEDALTVHWRLWRFISHALPSDRLPGNVLFVGHAATTIACARAVYSLGFESISEDHFSKDGPGRILVNAGYCSIVRMDLHKHPKPEWRVHTAGTVDHHSEDPVAYGDGRFGNWWYLEDRDRTELVFTR